MINKKGKKKKVNASSDGRAYIKTTYNNIIISFTNENGDVIAWSSAGKSGFKNTKKKNTPYASQVTANDVVATAMKYGVKNVKVYISGAGTGRDVVLRTILDSGIHITEITDTTPIPHNGCRPPKRKRN